MKIDPKPVDCAAVLQVLAERYLEEEKRGGTPDYAIALEYGADLLKREAFVQQVIRRSNQLAAFAVVGGPDYDLVRHYLICAAAELAEWSPT